MAMYSQDKEKLIEYFFYLSIVLFLASCSVEREPSQFAQFCKTEFTNFIAQNPELSEANIVENGAYITNNISGNSLTKEILTETYQVLTYKMDCKENTHQSCTSMKPIWIVEENGGFILEGLGANYFYPYVEIRFEGGDLKNIENAIQNQMDMNLERKTAFFLELLSDESLNREQLVDATNGYEFEIPNGGLTCMMDGDDWFVDSARIREFDTIINSKQIQLAMNRDDRLLKKSSCSYFPENTYCKIEEAVAECEEIEKNKPKNGSINWTSNTFGSNSCSNIGLRSNYDTVLEEWADAIF